MGFVRSRGRANSCGWAEVHGRHPGRDFEGSPVSRSDLMHCRLSLLAGAAKRAVTAMSPPTPLRVRRFAMQGRPWRSVVDDDTGDRWRGLFVLTKSVTVVVNRVCPASGCQGEGPRGGQWAVYLFPSQFCELIPSAITCLARSGSARGPVEGAQEFPLRSFAVDHNISHRVASHAAYQEECVAE